MPSFPILTNPYFPYPNPDFSLIYPPNYFYQPMQISPPQNNEIQEINFESHPIQNNTKKIITHSKEKENDKKPNSDKLRSSKQRKSNKNQPVNIEEAIKQCILFRRKAQEFKLA